MQVFTIYNQSRLAPLNSHYEYLLQLGEVRATKVISTLVDGVVGHANRDDTEENMEWDIGTVTGGTCLFLDI
jgi:hypothetical protein